MLTKIFITFPGHCLVQNHVPHKKTWFHKHILKCPQYRGFVHLYTSHKGGPIYITYSMQKLHNKWDCIMWKFSKTPYNAMQHFYFLFNKFIPTINFIWTCRRFAELSGLYSRFITPSTHKLSIIFELAYWHWPVGGITGSKSDYWHRLVESLRRKRLLTPTITTWVCMVILSCLAYVSLTVYYYSSCAM